MGGKLTGKRREDPSPQSVVAAMKLVLGSLLLVMVAGPSGCSGAKILLPATSLMSMPSHYMGLTTFTQALVDRGHDVTLLTIDKREVKGFRSGSYTANITYPNSKSDVEIAELYEMKKTMMATIGKESIFSILSDPRISLIFEYTYFGCSELFAHSETLQRLKGEDFDLILTFPVSDFCDALLAAYLDVPYVVVLGSRRSPSFHEGMLGIPTPNSYVPFSIFTERFSDQMSFFERVQNAIFRYVVHGLMEYMTVYRPLRQIQKLHDIRPDLTPQQMVQDAKLWLCHSTWALEYARPIAPNWIPIPGYTITEPKPLPDDLREFVESSGEDGVVLFSLGSMTVSLSNEGVTDAFSRVFSELSQKVIWRYVGPTPSFLGNNTLLTDWLPQNDLMAHPKVRLLIYHGGSAGLHEAIHYGVPMLLIPLAGDQGANAHLVAAKGMGLVLDQTSMDEDVIRNSIHEILLNDSYKRNAEKASAIMRDQIASPLDTGVFWIEHVLKFGGDHLRLRGADMGFVELHSLDVVAFLAAVLLLWAYLTYLVVGACCRCCRQGPTKAKND